jgi:hypothetical protein
MININCFVGLMNQGPLPPPLFLDPMQLQGRIGNIYQVSSGGDINLTMHPAVSVPNPAPPGYLVTGLDLHVCLARLIGAPRQGPVTRVGLLLANFYQPFPKALGVMFDRGMPTVDDPNPAAQFVSVPREGCAVFLGAIAKLRPAPEAFDAEARFTAIHELGHVFNLPHTVDHLTFMSPSSPAGPYPPGNVHFDPRQCDWLAHCSTSPLVAPGGVPFGQVGPGGPLDPYAHFNMSSRNGTATPVEFGLELTIGMKRREFWQFEPVDLDVGLSVMPGVQRQFRVPEMIDLGYSRFSIFVEEPTGERRRVRSVLRHCLHPHRMLVTPNRPYERDIAIFRDADGYVFRNAGIHRIQAIFQIGPHRTLHSNLLEVNVLPETSSDKARDAARVRLARPRARLVLYHKQDLPDRKGLKLLSGYLDDEKSTGSLATAVRYALGRAYLSPSAGSHAPPTKRQYARGRDELKQALDSGHLSRHHEKIAAAWLEKSV